MSMLQRACVGLDQVQAAAGPVETQTLSMGMGLVATLLSGPSPVLHTQLGNTHHSVQATGFTIDTTVDVYGIILYDMWHFVLMFLSLLVAAEC